MNVYKPVHFYCIKHDIKLKNTHGNIKYVYYCYNQGKSLKQLALIMEI